MMTLGGLPSKLRQFSRFLVYSWTRQYQDARIILEQNGDLKYLNIPAHLQRLFVRSTMITTGVLLLMILFLASTSINLFASRARLEKSHEEVYKALLNSALDGKEAQDVQLSEDQMVALAQTIRDRDMSIRRFVDTSMVAVTQENDKMKSQLDSSGLTEKIVKIIQQNSANGGLTQSDAISENPLLRGKVADELSTNRALREVLYALPTQMPISNYSVSSDFGIRKHPVTGVPHFHTGVDLLTATNDDNVHPVKPGIIVMAEFHSTYGNTVVVRHTNGVESLYAHLSAIAVKVGDKVTMNDVVGRIGNTGVSTGKHLHLEILVGGYPVNPQKVIRTAQYVQQIQQNNKQQP
jgi:murein DD-endopeptidase MepM/ murein hydrolase activator NlpD